MSDFRRRIAAEIYNSMEKITDDQAIILFNEELGSPEIGVTIIDRDNAKTYSVVIKEISRPGGE